MLPIIAFVVVVLDQASKAWITSILEVGGSMTVWGNLAFTYVRNTGAAFGLFVDSVLIVSILGIVAVILILVFYRFLAPASNIAMIALSLVFGGAVGNLIDRLRLGYVVDFIDVRLWGNFHWPTFNVADSAITVGSLMLIYFFLALWRKETPNSERGQQ